MRVSLSAGHGEHFPPGSVALGDKRPTAAPDRGNRPIAPPPRGSVIAAPWGTPDGNGTVWRPLDLATALSAKSPVRPGKTLLLRGGTYRAAYTSRLAGTEKQPIVVRSYPLEWAVLDGITAKAPTLDVQGPDVWFRDFEVMKSDPDRHTHHGSNAPPDLSRAKWSGIWVEGPRTKLINLVIHDNGDGVGIWRHSGESEVYGCLIFNNGWLGGDHAWGHGIYAQNASGTKSIKDNIVFNNFGWGVHAYDRLGPITGIDITGVTSFENGAPAGTRYPNVLVGSEHGSTDRIVLQKSVLYHRPGVTATNAMLGYEEVPGVTKERGSIAVSANHIAGGSRALLMRGWRRAVVKDNLLFARPNAKGWAPVLTEWIPSRRVFMKKSPSYRWDENAYRTSGGPSTTAKAFALKANGQDRYMPFTDWREATGFDARADYSLASPSDFRVFVRPNRYERGRANITVLNWRGETGATVDLSTVGLRVGEEFEIRDVQNLKAEPLVRSVYLGGPVTVPLTSTDVAQPIGNARARVRHTSAEFGAFVVLPVHDAAATPSDGLTSTPQ